MDEDLDQNNWKKRASDLVSFRIRYFKFKFKIKHAFRSTSDTELPESLKGDILGVVIFGFSVWGVEIGGLEMDEGRVGGWLSKIVVYPSLC